MVSPGLSGIGGAGGPGDQLGQPAAEEVAATSEAAEAAAPRRVRRRGWWRRIVVRGSGATGVAHMQGDRAGNGEVIITW